MTWAKALNATIIGVSERLKASVTDVFAPQKRSQIMSRVRGFGNASTELRVIRFFREAHITGWRRHPTNLPGSPDFIFPVERVAIHIHGCFWHGCRRCSAGKPPKTRLEYWLPKIAKTRARDDRNRRALRRAGFRTVQVWEHELRHDKWLRRVHACLNPGN